MRLQEWTWWILYRMLKASELSGSLGWASKTDSLWWICLHSLLLSQNWKPISSLTHTDLFFSVFSFYQSIASNACICRVCVCVCASVCVCACDQINVLSLCKLSGCLQDGAPEIILLWTQLALTNRLVPMSTPSERRLSFDFTFPVSSLLFCLVMLLFLSCNFSANHSCYWLFSPENSPVSFVNRYTFLCGLLSS